jgi:hypothetical protein
MMTSNRIRTALDWSLTMHRFFNPKLYAGLAILRTD